MKIAFSIAASARRRIEALVDALKRQNGLPEVIPAVMWLDADLNPDIATSRVVIGFYDNRADIIDDITVEDGFAFVLAVTRDDERLFDGQELHYIDDAFVLKQRRTH
ncbi:MULTISPECIES: hypothetical protein [unclassified Bradyrhizobium]|uniref:hypothetical protein n=1 Tax=unclassified Bradyrhizobium TaxID=2631580 RepID=UPI000240A744|nr:MULTISPECIES: hypothetical protein [unclassified Bradyrhizobium]CCD92881.1 hypothetical protein BRAO375_230021 [Bradyrhizobium sp. ORS 375]